jgi:sugar lactone lactonase YvrE
VVTTVAGTATCSYSGDNGPATQATICHQEGIFVDATGNLLIADYQNRRIRRVDGGTGIITTIAGIGYPAFVDPSPTANVQLNTAGGVAAAGTNTIYFSDRGNHRVLKVDAAAGTATRFAGQAVAAISGSFSGDGGLATDAALYFPEGIALDSIGNLYIADSFNQRIRKIDATTHVITTIAGAGGPGSFSGDDGPATAAHLNYPKGIVVDGQGNVFFSDNLNYRIRKIEKATGKITTVAGTGTAGYSGDGGPATAAQLNGPAQIALDAAGNLYIADYYNHRVRKVSSNTITTVAGTGVIGFGVKPNGTVATQANIAFPEGVAVDASGAVYFSEYDNEAVYRISSTGTLTLVAGGKTGYSGDNGPAVAASFQGPAYLGFDGAGNLFISEYVNERLRAVRGPLP